MSFGVTFYFILTRHQSALNSKVNKTWAIKMKLEHVDIRSGYWNYVLMNRNV